MKLREHGPDDEQDEVVEENKGSKFEDDIDDLYDPE